MHSICAMSVPAGAGMTRSEWHWAVGIKVQTLVYTPNLGDLSRIFAGFYSKISKCNMIMYLTQTNLQFINKIM